MCMLTYEEHTFLYIKLAGREYDKYQSQKNLRNHILQLSHYTKDFKPMPGFTEVRAGYWQRIRTWCSELPPQSPFHCTSKLLYSLQTAGHSAGDLWSRICLSIFPGSDWATTCTLRIISPAFASTRVFYLAWRRLVTPAGLWDILSSPSQVKSLM